MSCQVEQLADCGDISTIGRALFVPDKDEPNWLAMCSVSLSPCGNLLVIAYKNRLCVLTTQWISATDSNSFLISSSWSVDKEVTALLALPICPSQQSSQSGPDWFCIIVGFSNGSVGFYTNTGHLLLLEKLDEKAVMRISCHTGTYGILPDDVHVLFQSCECIISGSHLFQTLRTAKSHLAKVQAGLQDDFVVDSRNIRIKKWTFAGQEVINDAAVVGLELKNTYDHLLAASVYGGYDTWYRSVPPINTLILGAGSKPYVGFHYALEGGTAPPLQDVARAVANKIKSALPGWLGGGSSESAQANTEPYIKVEALSMRYGLPDSARHGTAVAVSPDRRLAAVADNLGRVVILDVKRGHLIRMFKGYRDAQLAFLQIFEQEKKKPQLSVIKEIKRAVFLIIYNPKKGLIDIRLMQKGNRVAVFTATKNGKLIYNTCGLVGAEKSYTHRKLNYPEFQCVLMDPDGKLKKFSIPFFYALEGEHSDKSKDVHILRDLRSYIKKYSIFDNELIEEVTKRASQLKTLEMKKHLLDVLIRNNDVSPGAIISCVKIFMDDLKTSSLTEEEEKFKNYIINIINITLFYRNINNENVDDMAELISDICTNEDSNEGVMNAEGKNEEDSFTEEKSFHLLEDDNCILERLLVLAQESNYKDHQHVPRVTFSDNTISTYKEFVSCFQLDNTQLLLKEDLPNEKINNLARDTFKKFLKIKSFKNLANYIKKSKLDPKEIVRIVIIHLMNMPLSDFSIEVIEKIIEVLFYICSVSDEATDISYNQVSPWWQDIRDMLVEMSCPLRSLIVAMAFKATAKNFEDVSYEATEEAWESVTKENAHWGLLIGKLEDISILSIVIMFKDNFEDDSCLPKLQPDEININLKYIYTRGKGSVTELIAKWLCSMGVPPEAIIANELMDQLTETSTEPSTDDSDDTTFIYLENHRDKVENNPKIFKWLSLLRRQFPLSTSTNYLIGNMCWEYANYWQKDMQKLEFLKTVIHCLKSISNLHLRVGLSVIIWSTYIKHTFEASCRLVNKVGKLPKDPLCLQDVGFGSEHLIKLLEITAKYLDELRGWLYTPISQPKEEVVYEKIWDENLPSLVEVAQNKEDINLDILNLNFQIACSIYYQCRFNVKFSKPLDLLFDIDYHYIFEAFTENVPKRDINMIPSEKLKNPRKKFLTKLIRSSVDTITCIEDNESKYYNKSEFLQCIEHISDLAELWSIGRDYVTHQQAVALYHMGYDSLAINVIDCIKDPELLLTPILAITTQRLKRSFESSPNQPEWIVTLQPHMYKRLQTTELDPSVPANPSLETTMHVLQRILYQINKKTDSPSNKQNLKLAELMIDSCNAIFRKKL